MKFPQLVRLLMLTLFVVLFSSIAIDAQTTAFNYQGSLTESNSSASGTYDFQFALYDVMTGGNQIGTTQTHSVVNVSNGSFTVQLDFGNNFPGADRYLEISVKKPSDSNYTTLSPRHSISSTPYSIRSLSAATADTTTNATQLGGVAASNYAQTNSTAFIRNQSTQQTADFNINGTGTATYFNAASEYWINDETVLRAPGNSNVFLGDNTGRNSTGFRNALLGTSAGAFLTTGSYNAFAGPLSGWTNTTGNGNSYLGYLAGDTNGDGTGSFNTAAGHYAHQGVLNLNYTTAVGAYAVVNTNDTIVIGKAAGNYPDPANLGNETARPADTVQIPGNLVVNGTVTADGSNLTSLNASNITSGTLNNARLGVVPITNGGTGSSTQNFVDLSTNQTSINGNKTFTGTVAAATFSGSGSGLTGLDASNINSGTVADSLLSTNVALKNAANTFTANQTINANLTQTGTTTSLSLSNGFVVKNRTGSFSIPASGSGTRMMFYPAFAAFRSGTVLGSQWDAPNIGYYSSAFGYNTIASGESSFAAGDGSTASGHTSFAFGWNVAVSGKWSAALGSNVTASCSFNCLALGTNASTSSFGGTFVWGDDSGGTTLTASDDNQFNIRASGGIRMFTSSNLSSGVQVEAGGGSWSSLSDRNMKVNFAPVNPREILRGVLRLPISTWNYKTQNSSIRHIGAMAQDFYKTFKVGEDDKHISTIDPDGVALAAIQGLNEELKERDVKIEQQEKQNEAQEKQIEAQQKQINQQQQKIDALIKLVCSQNTKAQVCKQEK